MRPISITRALAALDADGIATAQQRVGAGNLTLNGALVTSGVAQLGSQRVVALDSAGNLSGVTFTITGTDDAGNTISQAIAGPNTTPTATTLNFKTVTQVAVSATIATDVIVGTSGVGGSQTLPLDIYLPYGSTASIDVTGTVNVSVQVTNDNPFPDSASTILNWVSHPTAALVTATSDQTGATANAYRAMRLLTNSGTGSCVLTITQQGLAT